MTTDCRLLNIVLKQRQNISSLIAIQDQIKKLEPILMEQEKFFQDKDKVAANVISKEEIVALVKSFQDVEVLVANVETKLREIKKATFFMQRCLIKLFQDQA